MSAPVSACLLLLLFTAHYAAQISGGARRGKRSLVFYTGGLNGDPKAASLQASNSPTLNLHFFQWEVQLKCLAPELSCSPPGFIRRSIYLKSSHDLGLILMCLLFFSPGCDIQRFDHFSIFNMIVCKNSDKCEGCESQNISDSEIVWFPSSDACLLLTPVLKSMTDEHVGTQRIRDSNAKIHGSLVSNKH